MAERTIFITGATGLLGTEVVAHLLTMVPATIYVLVRAHSVVEAEHRLHALWCDDTVLSSAIGERVLPVVGDITDDAFMPDRHLPDSITHVIHCAAETGIQKSREELWRINVEGTRHVVQWAEKMPRLQRFTYVSTAYVAGTMRGHIMEAAKPLPTVKGNLQSTPPTSFYSLYEQSKAEAECIVRASSLPLTICRPGMIVGNSKTGRTRNFNTVYYVLKLMLQGKLRVLPVSKRQTVNVVPVDYVALQVASLTLNAQAEGLTFHLVAPASQLPRVGELVTAVSTWAKEQLHIDLPHPVYMPLPLLRTIGKRYNTGAGAKSRSLLSNLTALLPYFLDDHVFDRTNTTRLTGDYTLEWREFLPSLLSFACRHNFMHLSDKSIFGQAVVRRESRHYPITYYNITANGTERITGREMNSIVSHYVEMLRQLGVKQGDRVALSGVNCAEHAAIDNAIGLMGAVSVPIYYTTPADETALLLRKSGARWFFVGTASLAIPLQKASPPTPPQWERGLQIPANVVYRWVIGNDYSAIVIPFGPLAPKKENFTTQQQNYTLPSPLEEGSGVRPSGNMLATIRYTSGTTGEPKGVVFNFNQLKWMGEVLTNLLSWRDRNSEMRYLSFLPMSHVVEGILAAYAPYCMLCRAEIYYMTEFQMLTKSLPLVRPTVFFSVPRFYEKLWEQIEQNTLGRRYLTMNEGWLKRLTGRLLRRGVLRKAGLDKCSQLLVGSAPMSEELLHRFRELGIEIHNAYGQTEAPLITLNRLGDNVIPSIGTPLPDTTVTTNTDGELIVEGPQVAMGYYQLESDTFRHGKLYTGDLGHIAADGHVYINGRKKDMLITSYGKNINCTKIEQRLCDIACVEHAVLVGEQRPYCTALLWTNGPAETLQGDIERMNQHLSHPEQVKRWRIITTPLSIKNGELTPNLKVKRTVVAAHYHQEIEKMYSQ